MHNLSCSLWPQVFLAMFSKSKFVSERNDSDRPDKRLRRNVSDLFLSGAISAGRAATVFQDAEFDGATGVADLAVNEGKNAQRDLVRKLMQGSKRPPLYAAKIPVLHQKHIKCWKNLSICCCHMKSWQMSCPGTGTPNRRSLTGQGFQLQPESTLRKQCLCWEWIPPPASLWGCGQMVALSNGTEANLSLLLQ